MVTTFIVLFLFLLAAIILHEIGHALYINRAIKGKTRIIFYWKGITKFGLKTIYIGNLTTDQEQQYYVWGVFVGYVPLLIASLLTIKFSLYLFPIYTAGCRSDFMKLIKIINTGLEDGKDTI